MVISTVYVLKGKKYIINKSDDNGNEYPNQINELMEAFSNLSIDEKNKELKCWIDKFAAANKIMEEAKKRDNGTI